MTSSTISRTLSGNGMFLVATGELLDGFEVVVGRILDLVAAVVVVGREVGVQDHGVVAGDGALDDEPLASRFSQRSMSRQRATTTMPLRYLQAAYIYARRRLGAVLVELDEDVGHDVVRGDHLAVHLEHHVDEAVAGAL